MKGRRAGPEEREVHCVHVAGGAHEEAVLRVEAKAAKPRHGMARCNCNFNNDCFTLLFFNYFFIFKKKS